MRRLSVLSFLVAAILSREALAAEVVIVPTLRNDHQFNPDYHVAHLMVLLDAVAPDALLVDDYTEWLRRECPWNAVFPEAHAALGYAQEKSIEVFGTDMSPKETLESSLQIVKSYSGRYRDPQVIATEFRQVLDTNGARIARDFSFASRPRDLAAMLSDVFPKTRNGWTDSQRAFHLRESQRISEQVERVVLANSRHRRWAIVLWWGHALLVENALQNRDGMSLIAISNYLPLDNVAVNKRLDFKHTAWILSGVLDEWYGMWAPQAFDGKRIAVLLNRLKNIAPDDPTTTFLEARWLMRNRDFRGSEPLLTRLIERPGDSKLPFPINGKWVRPPWSSVRQKAKLNLAFVHDYHGEREKALNLYHELLEAGERLNEEARAIGYVYDDIQTVVHSYTVRPYTGGPEEAFRHFPIVVREPTCAPSKQQSR